jgi:hypothetical protein
MNQEFTDDQINAEWRLFLEMFHKFQKKNDFEGLKKLKEDAKVNKKLTYRQIDGIVCRCDNVMNGTYGNTKTELNLNQGKPSSKR